MDTVRKLITEKLAEKQLSMKDASIKMERAHSYLYQFLKKNLPRELHERDRISLANILGLQEDDLRGPSTQLPKRSHEKKVVSTRDSLIDQSTQSPHSAHGNTSNKNVPGAELFGANDLPVFGTSPGGRDGALSVSEAAVDWVARPAVLMRVRDGYGIIVTDDAMSPEHKMGSIALVNPHLPPRVGSSCVFRSREENGTALVLIREFRGQTDTHWKLHQHNPAKDVQVKKSDWTICHRTVGNYFP